MFSRLILTRSFHGALRRGMVGTIAHPLHQAIIHPTLRIVVAGYGILQPRIGVSVRSASRSRMAAIFSGQSGFDIYTRAISDAYQDLYGEGYLYWQRASMKSLPSMPFLTGASRAIPCSATI
jgi:hypothetical protein